MKADNVALISALFLLLLSSALLTTAQATADADTATPASQSNQQQTFLFVQRTDNHVKRSSSEVFSKVLNELKDYLKSKNVILANSDRHMIMQRVLHRKRRCSTWPAKPKLRVFYTLSLTAPCQNG